MKILFVSVFLTAFIFLNAQPGTPKNIIILIGDGMGVNTVSVSVLSSPDSPFRKFSVAGFSVTCSADALITDSAAGATALATGYRTNNAALSVDPDTGEPMLTIFELAESLGKSTGVVVSSTVTHATPAAFLSHVPARSDERGIALQYPRSGADVVIGGGMKYFKPEINLMGTDINLLDSIRTYGNDIYDDYNDLKERKPSKGFYALLADDALPKAGSRNYSLGELTETALNQLSRNKKGFILMVEGSQIDWQAHDNRPGPLQTELADFSTAIHTALDFAEKEGNTLVIVTADHETGGVTIPDGKTDGSSLLIEFSTRGHTPAMVGVFAEGPGAELFTGVNDNFMLGRKLFSLVDKNHRFD